MPNANSEPDTARFLRELMETRLLDSDEIQSRWNTFCSTVGSSDFGQFLQHLVKSQALTGYQAEQIVAGHANRLICGPYVLLSPVGSGSIGTTYRALGRNDGKFYAVKVAPLRNLWNAHLAKQQLRSISSLPSHPAIVPFATLDSTSWCHYFAWPWIDGETLEKIVETSGRQSPEQSARWLAEIADGLSACHRAGVYYGTLKPANIRLDGFHRPKLLDLGVGAILAGNLATEESMLDTVSSANSAIGMVDYSAPELSSDPAQLTAAADVYGIGAVLYFLLTGSPPFPDGTSVEKFVAQQRSDPQPIRERNPAVPQRLAELITQLLRRSPADRPTDLLAVRDDLLSIAGTTPVPTPALIPPTRPTVETPPPELPVVSTSMFVPPPLHQPQAMTVFSVDAPVPPPRPKNTSDSDALSLADLTRSVDPQTHAGSAPPSFKPIPVPSMVARAPAPSPPPPVPTPIGRLDWAPLLPKTSGIPPIAIPPPPRFRWPILHRRIARLFRPQLPRLDVVQASVFAPGTPTVGSSVRVQVCLHRPATFVSIRSLIRSLHPNDQLLAVGYFERPVEAGELIGVHFSAAGLRVEGSLAELVWTGASEPLAFPVTIPTTARSGSVAAIVTLGLNGITAGRLPFEWHLTPAG